MANNSIFQPILGEPGAVDVVDSVPKPDTSASTLLQGGVDIYTKAHKDILTKQAENEFSSAYKDYVAADEANNLLGAVQQTSQLRQQTEDFFQGGQTAPPEEAVLLTDMQQRINKWNKAFLQKRIPASEFKVKMESTLKKYIAMAPSLAGEFRKAASGTLGFDPTGAEFSAIEAQQKADLKTTDQVKKLALKTIDKVGLMDASLSDDENIRRYAEISYDLVRREHDLKLKKESLDYMNVRGKTIDNNYSSKNVSITLGQATGMMKNIRPAQNEAEKSHQIDTLNGFLAKTASEYRNKYPTLSGAEIDAKLKPVSDLVNSAIDVVNGKRRKETLDNMVSGTTSAIISGLQGTQEGARFVAAVTLFRGWQSLPAPVVAKMGSGSELLWKMQVDLAGGDGTHSPFSKINNLPDNDIKTPMKKWFSKNATETINHIDPNNPNDERTAQNMIEGVMVPMFTDPDKVEQVEWDTMLKMASNPKFVEVLKNMPDSERIKNKLSQVSASYSVALVKNMANNLEPNYNLAFPSSQGKTRYMVLDRDENGLFKMIPNPDALRLYKGKDFGKFNNFVNHQVDVANKQFVTRLNDAVKVTAHLRGHTKYKQMVDQIIKQQPTLFAGLVPGSTTIKE